MRVILLSWFSGVLSALLGMLLVRYFTREKKDQIVLIKPNTERVDETFNDKVCNNLDDIKWVNSLPDEHSKDTVPLTNTKFSNKSQ